MRRVAVTGGIAEGKSTVLAYLRDLGYTALSIDDVAREVFSSQAIQEALGSLLALSPPIAPEALRERLRENSLRRAVNAVMHPVIRERMNAIDARFVEVPLLIEACMQADFDRVWVVTCGPEEQLRRLSERLGSQGSARDLVRTQLTSRVKLAFADVVIRTNQDESTVKRCVSVAAERDAS